MAPLQSTRRLSRRPRAPNMDEFDINKDLPAAATIPQHNTETPSADSASYQAQRALRDDTQSATNTYSIVWVRCREFDLDVPVGEDKEDGENNCVIIHGPSLLGGTSVMESDDMLPSPNRQKLSDQSAAPSPIISPPLSINVELQHCQHWARYTATYSSSTGSFSDFIPICTSEDKELDSCGALNVSEEVYERLMQRGVEMKFLDTRDNQGGERFLWVKVRGVGGLDRGMDYEFFCKMRIVGGGIGVLGQGESARLGLGLGGGGW